MNLILSAAIASIALAAAGPAAAETPKPADAFAFHFTYAPSELSTQAGAQKLLVRLESKVRAYCGSATSKSVEERRLVATCVDATMKANIGSFGSSTVAEAFQSRAAG